VVVVLEFELAEYPLQPFARDKGKRLDVRGERAHLPVEQLVYELSGLQAADNSRAGTRRHPFVQVHERLEGRRHTPK
jgi:hypothetical protein